METIDAVTALAALAQPHRLEIFRLLVAAGPKGLAAGEVAAKLSLAPNTLTFHFDRLRHAALIAVRREGRSMIYAARFDAMNDLLGFLTDNCCNNHPDLCQPARKTLQTTGGTKPVADRPLHVLFLCTGNSARSMIAEAILNKLGNGRFRAYSAGSKPKGLPHPQAVALLERLGYDTSDLRSKSWLEFAQPNAPALDFVITVCDDAAGETCPVWPGKPTTAHWGISDPAAARGNNAEIALAFAETHRLLLQRISIFVSLPFETLSAMSLQKELRTIGGLEGATAMTKAAKAKTAGA
jgi:arsenate reductase